MLGTKIDPLMLMPRPEEAVRVHFDGGCSAGCDALSRPLYEQLSTGPYSWPASVQELTGGCLRGLPEWRERHRTARKRAWLAREDGFKYEPWIDRVARTDEVWAINTSALERQGRPMAATYLERPTFGPVMKGACPNRRHQFIPCGVTDSQGVLRAYAWVYRCGDLVMISSILGHADYLTRHVMYLLLEGLVEDEACRPGRSVMFYNRHDSGTEGLRFFKERVGFRAARVEWSW